MPHKPRPSRVGAARAPAIGCALGLDAGGTATRWALTDGRGALLEEGHAPALGGAQLPSAPACLALEAALAGIARTLSAPPQALFAGITGYDGLAAGALLPRLAQAFDVPVAAVHATSDIELLCRSAFAPGAGLVLVAGTGAIAGLLDRDGLLQRAGGYGPVIDDAGGGYWIARQALRQVWRAEDEAPGAWRRSALALALVEHIGGSDWAATRQWVYGASRGELGALAVQVAAVAHEDRAALAILEQAGRELARLVLALHRRHGALPVALAGRVFELHPAVRDALRSSLPAGTPVQALSEAPHIAAARLALQTLTRRTR